MLFRSNSCTISGTPTSVGTGSYTITATNGAGNDPIALTLTVNNVIPNISYSNPYVFNRYQSVTITPTNTGGAVTSCAGAVPAGLTRNADCSITGNPSTVSAATNYPITATDSAGSQTPVNVNIKVNEVLPNVAYSGPLISVTQASSVGGALTPTNVNGGTITNCVASTTGMSLAALGLTLNTSTCAITGTPSAAQAAALYTITATSSAGNQVTSFTLTVSPAVATLQFVVGASSPNPPNPDNFGTTNVTIAHTYTLKNVGGLTTTAVTMSITGANAANFSLAADNCSGFTLAPNATCTMQVDFNAGTAGTAAAAYTATLQATAANSTSTPTNTVNANAAYTDNCFITPNASHPAGGFTGGSCAVQGADDGFCAVSDGSYTYNNVSGYSSPSPSCFGNSIDGINEQAVQSSGGCPGYPYNPGGWFVNCVGNAGVPGSGYLAVTGGAPIINCTQLWAGGNVDYVCE